MKKYIILSLIFIALLVFISRQSNSQMGVITGGGGSMTYPTGDGIAVVSGGTSWGTTISAPTDTTKTYFILRSGSTYTFVTSFSYDGTANNDIWTMPTPTAGSSGYQIANKTYADSLISDTTYSSSWNGVTTIAPSKNAVYDQMELRLPLAGGTMTGDFTTKGVIETASELGNCGSSAVTPVFADGTIFTTTVNSASTCTINNPSSIATGRSFTIYVTHSSTGSLAFGNAYKWPAGIAPTWSTTSTKYDVVFCASFDGTTLSCNGLVDVR